MLPTIEVRYDPIEKLKVASGILARASNDTASVGVPLTRLAGKASYGCTVDVGAEAIVRELTRDVSEKGLPLFEKLEDLDWVLENLSSEDPAEWCVPSVSLRARLLPLMWYLKGNADKALDELRRLKDALSSRDQMIPKIEHFETWFVRLIQEKKSTQHEGRE